MEGNMALPDFTDLLIKMPIVRDINRWNKIFTLLLMEAKYFLPHIKRAYVS